MRAKLILNMSYLVSILVLPSTPLSSMVFGTNALFTKPAQSFAPMLVVYILNIYGYEDMKDGNVTDPR